MRTPNEGPTATTLAASHRINMPVNHARGEAREARTMRWRGIPLWRGSPPSGGRISRPLRGAATLLLLAMAAASVGCAARPAAGPATPTVDAAAARQRLDGLARQAVADFTRQVQTSYDGGSRATQVTATVGWTADIGIGDIEKSHERAKAICFLAQRALWTSGVPLREATVTVLGPVQDDYGSQIIDAHAAAYLAANTSAGFAWGSLTADAAWDRYDREWLRPNYQPNVVHRPV